MGAEHLHARMDMHAGKRLPGVVADSDQLLAQRDCAAKGFKFVRQFESFLYANESFRSHGCQ
jgi:hypothetical protein